MKAISIICALVVLTFGVQLQAEESSSLTRYLTTLDHVEFQSDATNLHLSNGTVYSNTLLSCENEMLQLWNTGDRIVISRNDKRQGSLLLQNLDSEVNYFPQVILKPMSQKNLLTIEKVEKARDLKYAYFDSFVCNVLLSDGSFWEAYFSENFLLWNEGDHILISYEPEDLENDNEPDSVIMINCDLIQTENYEAGTHYFEPTTPVALEKFPTIQKIEIRKENQWSINPTAFLILSDESSWKRNLWDKEDEAKLEIWFVGDRVIVGEGYRNDINSITNYSIISTNINSDATVYFDSVE